MVKIEPKWVKIWLGSKNQLKTISIVNINSGVFDNVGRAFIGMFTAFTTENYPDLMFPAYHFNRELLGVHEVWKVEIKTHIFFINFLLLFTFYYLPELNSQNEKNGFNCGRNEMFNNTITVFYDLMWTP